MATKESLSHLERTAREPRDDSLHALKISKITRLNPSIRLFQLTPLSPVSPSASNPSQTYSPPPSPLTFKPGQWLDVHVPGIDRAGGFTITSPPSLLIPHPREPSPSPPPSTRTSKGISNTATQTNASSSTPEREQHNYYGAQYNRSGYLELAIQESPQNPPAAWLWQPEHEILGQEVKVRVGGSFVWPPSKLSLPQPLPMNSNAMENDAEVANIEQVEKKREIRRVVFIAGGVGVNPLMSMVSSLVDEKMAWGMGNLGFEVRLLYGTRRPGQAGRMSEVLFLDRLRDAFEYLGDEGALKVFLTGDSSYQTEQERSMDGEKLRDELGEVLFERRRMIESDLLEALGPVEDRAGTVCYICGVPSMTDTFVERLKKATGMLEENVLCEKWW